MRPESPNIAQVHVPGCADMYTPGTNSMHPVPQACWAGVLLACGAQANGNP